MSMIKIHGGGDDLIKVEGCDGEAEFLSYWRGPVMWRGDLIAPDGDAMRIHAVFYDECWSFALGQADEALPFPEWPTRFRQHANKDYSVLLEVDAPEGTWLRNESPPDEE